MCWINLKSLITIDHDRLPWVIDVVLGTVIKIFPPEGIVVTGDVKICNVADELTVLGLLEAVVVPNEAPKQYLTSSYQIVIKITSNMDTKIFVT